MNKDIIVRADLLDALRIKTEERVSHTVMENYDKHLQDIAESPEIAKIWAGYVKNYPYAKGIALSDILAHISWVFRG
jgi:hypothetical protein